MFQSVAQLVEIAEHKQIKIADVMIEAEMESTNESRDVVIEKMDAQLTVMEEAIEKGLAGVTSISGLTGGDATLLKNYLLSGKALSGDTIIDAVSKSIATNEVNAAMGLVCATPTAGSAGVVPGTLFAMKEKWHPSRKEMIEFLFTAGAFGLVVANTASISGAAGGCQAEVGTASGMAAAAIVEMAGGSPQQAAEAMAITLKNMLGLVCDPVAGLVEVPCVKRSAMGAANAMIAADMALAGIKSRIPCDEVIEAMYKIGRTMPVALRETALGGLAATKTARSLEEKIFAKKSPSAD